jgi:hypothetical protein
MGLFSSKKVTTVGTSVSRVIDNNRLPDSRKAGLISSVISGNELVPTMMDEVLQGIGIKGNRFFRWAKKNYIYSTFSGRYATEKDGDEEIEKILEVNSQYGINIEYSHLAPSNLLHAAWSELLRIYGYNQGNNTIPQLTTDKGAPVYLVDIIIVLPTGTAENRNPEELVKWGRSPSAGATPTRSFLATRGYSDYAESDEVTSETAFIYYSYVKDGIVYEENLQIVLPEFSDDDDYFHVKYTILDKPQTPILSTPFIGGINTVPQIIGYSGPVPNPADDPVRYWTYKKGEGTYPLLDTTIDSPSVSGEFFPAVYYRFNKAPMSNGGAYESAKKLNDFLGFDYDEIRSAINTNPDIKDVEQAMMTMGVPANTGNAVEINYLFDFFKRMATSDRGIQYVGGSTNNLFGSNWAVGVNATIIQDRLFKKALSNNGIQRKLILSNGPVGRVRMGIAKAVATEQTFVSSGGFFNIPPVYTKRVTTTLTEPSIFGGQVIVSTSSAVIATPPQNQGLLSFVGGGFVAPSYIHVYRKQITPDIEEEIRVKDLKLTYYIYKSYMAVGDWDDGSLIVPLDYSITRTYPLFEREELYARSLHYVFNSRVTVKVKWYQSSFFKFLLKAASLVLLVYSAGTSSWISGALIATGAFTATQVLILSFVINSIIGMVVQQVLKVFVKAVGLELALIISAFAAVYIGPKALAKYGMPGSTSAEQLLYVANGLINAKTELITEQIAGLADEFQELQLLKTEKEKELERANKLLESSIRIDPFIIFGESSDDYYNRMAHSGNIGVLSLDEPNKYVDMALMLPTIDQTLQV